jgi:putative transposase
MSRIARVIVPGYPHHITQRGNRRQQTFFSDSDYKSYIKLMSEWCGECGVQIWAYCLMPNHVHLIAVPAAQDGLRRAIGETHRRYTRLVNFREGWRGCLWQGRFSSFVMDFDHLYSAASYIENNPVRARLAEKAWQWKWSSAAAHIGIWNPESGIWGQQESSRNPAGIQQESSRNPAGIQQESSRNPAGIQGI